MAAKRALFFYEASNGNNNYGYGREAAAFFKATNYNNYNNGTLLDIWE